MLSPWPPLIPGLTTRYCQNTELSTSRYTETYVSSMYDVSSDTNMYSAAGSLL